MKKKLIKLITFFLFMGGLFVGNTVHAEVIKLGSENFPDAKLRRAIRQECYYYDEATDSEVSTIIEKDDGNYFETDNLTELSVGGFESLKGIELLTYLDNLQLYDFSMDNIEIDNKSLTELAIYDECPDHVTVMAPFIKKFILCEQESNNINSLDLTGCANLNDVEISMSKKLTSVKFPNNIVELACWENGITSLDVTEMSKLEKLNCRNNNISNLDVSKCQNLTEIVASYNKLSTINVKNLKKLRILSVDGNKRIKKIDVSKNKALECLDVDVTAISSLNVKNNKKLYSLNTYDTKIKALDLSKNRYMNYLYVDLSKLKTLKLNKKSSYMWMYFKVKTKKTYDLSKFIGSGYSIDKKQYYDKTVKFDKKTGKIRLMKKTTGDGGGASLWLKKKGKKYWIHLSSV